MLKADRLLIGSHHTFRTFHNKIACQDWGLSFCGNLGLFIVNHLVQALQGHNWVLFKDLKLFSIRVK